MKTWFPCVHILIDKWYFASKIVREIFLKFETEGRKFAKLLRSLEQSIQTVKGLRTIFGNNMLFLTCSWRFVPNRLGQQKVHACPSVPCNIFYILSMWTEREVHSQMSTLFHPWVHVIFSTFCPCVKIRSIYVIVEWPLMVFARMGYFFAFCENKKGKWLFQAFFISAVSSDNRAVAVWVDTQWMIFCQSVRFWPIQIHFVHWNPKIRPSSI